MAADSKGSDSAPTHSEQHSTMASRHCVCRRTSAAVIVAGRYGDCIHDAIGPSAARRSSPPITLFTNEPRTAYWQGSVLPAVTRTTPCCGQIDNCDTRQTSALYKLAYAQTMVELNLPCARLARAIQIVLDQNMWDAHASNRGASDTQIVKYETTSTVICKYWRTIGVAITTNQLQHNNG